MMKRYHIKRGVTAREANSMEEASRIVKHDTERRHIHISTVSTDELRTMLDEAGIGHRYLTDVDVRIECLRRYGAWYVIK